VKANGDFFVLLADICHIKVVANASIYAISFVAQ
jgi:hypothetical protein